ncbi:amidase [Bacillus sp. JJ1532]|uniref:amidase n=1 Tax=Bacillus sp. JJ1532 TaxID=3122958 RepID=UPI002FFDED30
MKVKSNDVLTWSLADLANGIEKREISPVEVTKLIFESIAEKDKVLNSYITVMEDRAMNDAMEAETAIQKGNYKGPLHGIPIAVKDNVYVKGVRNTVGSKIYKDFVPTVDAELINKLNSAGVIIIGKTNMHEFAFGASGDRSYFGPSRNPHNHEKITGGSSSGSGAAVAGNIAFGAIGSDTGGSIRIPSSCCGLVGMKPTYGSVSKYGTAGLASSLDHFGPMTRTVKDNAILLNSLVGFDAKDPYSIYRKEEDFTEELGKSVKDLTIGIPSSYYFDILQPEVQESINETIGDLKKYGVQMKPVIIDHLDELYPATSLIMASEAFSIFERELKEHPDKIEEEVKSRLLEGDDIKASEYLNAIKVKYRTIDSLMEAFKQVDIIFTPTLCVLPTDINQRELIIDGVKTTTRILNRLTNPMNTTGFPAISVPGISKKGLPVGLQLIGHPLSEKKLYRFAAFIEDMYQ